MGSKLGTILSLFFFALALFMGTDFLRLQFLHSELDALSVSIGEEIAIEGTITLRMRQLVNRRFHATLAPVTVGSAKVGEFFEYQISAKYTPLVISNEVMTITIRRMVLIGYMD